MELEIVILIHLLVSIHIHVHSQVVFAVVDFVTENMGPQFVESPAVKLSTLYGDMSKTTPLVFILSTGSDPMSSFLRFAKEVGYSERWVSMTICSVEVYGYSCENMPELYVCHVACVVPISLQSICV